MSEERAISLTIHGLSEDNGDVRADIFIEKLKALMESIRVADTCLNGRKSHNLVVRDLSSNSAHATLLEKVSVKRAVVYASPLVIDALAAIYAGDQRIDRYPIELVNSLAPLPRDVSRKFSHAEVCIAGKNIIRIDDYFARQMERAIAVMEGDAGDPDASFRGIAFGIFDGVVKELDARGIMMRGKLVLTAGGSEIDCVFNKDQVPKLRENFNKRSRVTAVAHYNGEMSLPERIDVRDIKPVKEHPDLIRWRGSLNGRRATPPEGL